MALTNEELQDILDNLTPEEQKQLYDKEARKSDDLIKRDFAAQKASLPLMNKARSFRKI